MNDYNQIIREHFNLSDSKTRKYIIALEDAQQNQLMSALASALYDKVTKNVDKIDFGTIPKSRGDITKVEGFDNTVECLNIIRSLVMEYKENPEIVDTVITAINNVKSSKSLFTKGFSLNANFVMTFYDLIVLAIEQSVSFMIAVTIQFIKDPSSQTVEMALDKAGYNDSKNNMLYQQLYSFNKSYASGELESTLRDVIKAGGKISESCNEDVDAAEVETEPAVDADVENEPKTVEAESEVDIDPAKLAKVLDDMGYKVQKKADAPCPGSECPETEEPESIPTPTMPINGSADTKADAEPVEEIAITATAIGVKTAIGIGAAIAAAIPIGLTAIVYLIKIIIPGLRRITFFLVNCRVSISDALEVQANLIEMNAYKLQYSTTSGLDDDKKKKVVDKQLKIAGKLKALSSKFALDKKKAGKEAEKMDEEDKKTVDDLKDKLPDNGDLF